jgi:hypothetical protein
MSLFHCIHKISNLITFALISFFTLSVFFGLYASSASVVFASFVRDYYCVPHGNGKVECCSLIKGTQWCTICDDTKPPSGCGERFPEPMGVAPPPSTQTCPENTAVDAKGNCAPLTQGPKEPPAGVDCTANPNDPSCKPAELKPSVDCTQNPDDPLCKPAGINPPSDTGNQSPDNNNNNPLLTNDRTLKGSDLGQSLGGETASKKGGNNNPTPPPCPKDNSPIPPNCTLKPKF